MAINEYMKFLREYDYIIDEDLFTVHTRVTLDQRKRGLTSQFRKTDTYSHEDLNDIKSKIDEKYKDDPLWKHRAYCFYFGLCTGLRRGNLLGLKASDLFPDHEVPHFVTRDNIVSGWSRGIRGAITLENSTKTFVGQVALPMVQPSVGVLQEVARHIKKNVAPESYILVCFPCTSGKWWKKICLECGFRYVNPHSWKHGYSTRGGDLSPRMVSGECLFTSKMLPASKIRDNAEVHKTDVR